MRTQYMGHLHPTSNCYFFSQRTTFGDVCAVHSKFLSCVTWVMFTFFLFHSPPSPSEIVAAAEIQVRDGLEIWAKNPQCRHGLCKTRRKKKRKKKNNAVHVEHRVRS